jgi:hypothetical protein
VAALFWPSNGELERQVQAVIDHYDGVGIPLTARLFVNDFQVDAETELADFTEASYNGYLAVQIGGTFGVPAEEAPGRWSSRSLPFGFLSPLTGSPVEIFGVYFTSDTEYFGAANLAEPVTLEVSGPDLNLRLTYRHLAAGLLEALP